MPVFNERDFIQAKVANLKQLDYPSDRLRVLLVNGPSSDGTTPLLEEAGSIDEEIHLIQLPRADKTAQLNAALATSTAEWVLVTDADALLPRGILKRLVGVASADPRIGSVGAAVNPEPARPIEKLHWRMLNALRLREGEAFHATILAGPCYLFRRSLVTSIPDDVVADDAQPLLLRALHPGLRLVRGGGDLVLLEIDALRGGARPGHGPRWKAADCRDHHHGQDAGPLQLDR